MKKSMFYASMAIVMGLTMTSCSVDDNPKTEPVLPAAVVATFEDANVQLNDKGYWNGGQIGEGVEGDWGETTWACKATSGLVTIECDYSYMDMGGYGYDWWGGIALSNRTGKELKDMDDQYNNIVGCGANNSANYAVVYGQGVADINVEGGAEVSYLYVANSAYAMQNILVGDGYSKKFEDDGDHLYLIVEATKADGTTQEEQIKLAEFTTSLRYITGWAKVDLSKLGKNVTKLTFKMTAHNSGVPLYCCVDDIAVQPNK